MPETTRIPFEEVRKTLADVLRTRDCPEDKAEKVAHEMARNALEGTYTHGINRFARLVRGIDAGIIDVHASPVRLGGFGAIENYDGQNGLGIPNAWFTMERAIALAAEHGIGLAAIRNNNHWLRAATYGYQACDAGMAGICFTNTIPNMPTWGARDARLGNNPIVLAFPHAAGHVLVDMAMSQFSYGALELAKLEGRQMPVDAGFDVDNHLSRDPSAVLESRRVLPTGYWKGAALSFVLDIFAGCMAMGNTAVNIGRLPGDEHGASQVCIAINYRKLVPEEVAEGIVQGAVDDLLASEPDGTGARIAYPGQRAVQVREENLQKGIPVDDGVWAEILSLRR